MDNCLDLSSRNLSEISELDIKTKIEKLILDNNSIALLTPNICKKLLYLSSLSLVGNKLKILPHEIDMLSSLKELYLDHNVLHELPNCIGNLKHLSKLHVTHNKLESFPESLSYLQNLSELIADENNIQCLPQHFGNLLKLSCLSLNVNNIKCLPENFVLLFNHNTCPLLSNLTSLELDKNHLKELPDEFGYLCNLLYLDLSCNYLKILPDSFCKLHLLEKCLLSSNYLSSLPENFGLLSLLKILKLNDNKLFELPESFGRLKLEILDLSCNKFRINPLSKQSMESLIQIDMHGNVYNSAEVDPHGLSENCSHWDYQCQVVKDVEVIDEWNSKHTYPCCSIENEDDLTNYVKELDQELNAFSMKSSDSLSDSDWENEAYENPRSFEKNYVHSVETDKSAFIPSDIHVDNINRTEIWHCVEDGQFDDADL